VCISVCLPIHLLLHAYLSISLHVYQGYSESHFRWVDNKTSNEKKKYYAQKEKYKLKLLLNLVTAETEALVISDTKICSYVYVKEVCRLWTQPRFGTFSQLLIVVEALWSQPVLQVGKQVVVARSEIRAIRMVVKQLPVEMLQQCSSASSCMRTRIAITHSVETRTITRWPVIWWFTRQRIMWRYLAWASTSRSYISLLK
jgi:hypothetical protein